MQYALNGRPVLFEQYSFISRKWCTPIISISKLIFFLQSILLYIWKNYISISFQTERPTFAGGGDQ